MKHTGLLDASDLEVTPSTSGNRHGCHYSRRDTAVRAFPALQRPIQLKLSSCTLAPITGARKLLRFKSSHHNIIHISCSVTSGDEIERPSVRWQLDHGLQYL